MKTINMLSTAESVQGQGVLSAYLEQVSLVKKELADKYKVTVNKAEIADITHYHTINLRYYLSLPVVKAKSKTVGYVHFLPETVDNSLNMPTVARKAFYKYMISFYKNMDYLVTVNPYFIGRLEHYGINRSKVTYIPNFVSDKKFFVQTSEQKADTRKKYGISDDAFVVLCVGQLQKRKGFFDFYKLAKEMPDITFAWAGDFAFGKFSDGYKEIKEISENPPDNLKLLGLIPREEMNSLYNIANVMFLPSYEELFPMTILESMNCSVPILLRDLDIYPDILFDFYLKGSDNRQFKSLILQLKNDPEFRKKACEASQRGHVFYSREHVAKLWEQFYDSIELKNK